MENYKVVINTFTNDFETIKEIRRAILKNEGFCPCRTEKILDTRCMCREFRERQSEGPCHCGLYYKVKI